MHVSAEILIVEENQLQAAQLQTILENHNFHSNWVATGEAALAALQERRPFVVLSSVTLPDMDGYHLCHTIKNDPQLKTVPVILMIPPSDSRGDHRALQSKADGIITQPYTEKFLLSRIKYVLSIQSSSLPPDLIVRKEEAARVKDQREFVLSADNARLLLDSNTTALLILSEEKHIRYANPAAETLFQQPASALLDTVPDFIGSVEESKKITVPRHSGPPLIAEIEVTGIVWEGRPAMLATLHDITAPKQAEEDLHHVNDETETTDQTKADFLANMSHEIRTPMNGIIGMTEILLGTALTAEQQECALTVKGCAQSLLGIVNDILDFSKIESGNLDLEFLDFDLRTTLETVTSLFSPKAAEKNIDLSLLTFQNVPNVLRGDPERIRQVLTNFVGNAIKFTEKGEVAIQVFVADESPTHVLIRFEVTDTGIGIPEDRMDRLFRMFSQVDTSSTRKYGGTGLGLAVNKKLVALMDGEVGVVSQLGKGSTFWFTARLEKSAFESVALIKPTRTHLHGLRALIVDENQTNRTILHHQLTSWGITVTLAESGAQALTLLNVAQKEQRPFDIGVLDWQMPEMDGLTLARAIRTRPEWNRMQLVFLTSVGHQGDGARARKAGIQAYLTKPVRQSQLFECLSLLASQPGQQPTPPPSNHSLLDTR